MSAEAKARPGTTWIDAMFMRGGTSKGLFFREQDLPPAGPQRDRVFTDALGSPDPFGRQLDGMGGGISSLSKVVSVAPSSRQDADVDYTFGQVSVREAVVDYSGNCGNLSAAVVPFALLGGIHEIPDDGPASVIAHNTNTGKLIEVRLEVADGVAVTSGDFVLPGVAGSGAPLELRYLDPSEFRTSGALPTGRSVDTLEVGGRSIEVSLVDVATPMVFVVAADLGLTGTELPEALDADAELAALLERIRRAGAVAMGLRETTEDAAQSVPKIAAVAPPADSVLLDGTSVPSDECDVLIRAASMGLSHRAIPGTSALCAVAAANIEGTVVQRCSTSSGSELRIATPSGVVAAAADVSAENGALKVTAASLFRTARPLMRGQVALPQ